MVTGGAGGIGRAMALRFAEEGMRVAVSDVDQAGAEAVASEILRHGGTAVAVGADVRHHDQVAGLADITERRLGPTELVCNNAGVIDMSDRPIWESPLEILRWQLDVNLWGVVHGMHVFIPRMLDRGGPGHVVNTASVAGLVISGHDGMYNTTKHAVVAASETTAVALRARAAPIGVSVLCPGFTRTGLIHADRNQPEEIVDDEAVVSARTARVEEMSAVLATAMAPAVVADHVVASIREGRFYVLPDPSFDDQIERRLRNVLARREPEA